MTRGDGLVPLRSPAATASEPGGAPHAAETPSRDGPPASLTTLVGRDRECAEVRSLLADARLLTLVGAAGCGKTRLATELSRELSADSVDGAAWVELAAVREPEGVATALATALGVRDQPAQQLVGAIVGQVAERDLLVVLDNCEHLVGACASLTARLLRACPRLRVLATTREPLAVDGEVVYPLEPLPTPAPGARTAVEVGAADAARLFELRARQVEPRFRLDDGNAEAVAEICRRLDGIPLAIELAAARVRVLAPAEIAEGLSDRFGLLVGGRRDAPTRQRTLEASIAWSYELLDVDQQLALARLSVFVGGFDLQAARAVAAADGADDAQLLEVVTSLAERSLLQVTVGGARARYRLLETIRAFALDRMPELEDPSRARDRHLAHFVGLAQRAGAGLLGREAEAWTARLAEDVTDLHAAMQWAVDSGRPLAVLDIAQPTQRFWLDRGRYPELERRLRAAVESPGATDGDRAKALTTATLLVASGHAPQAHAFADQAVALARTTGDDVSLSLSLAVRAYAGLTCGLASEEQVASDVDEAVELTERIDDAADQAYVLVFVGIATCYGRSLDTGVRLVQRLATICEDASVRFHLPAAHATLGLWLPFVGELDRGREHARSGVEWGRRIDRAGWEAVSMAGLALADLLSGWIDPARERLAEAESLLRARHLTPSAFESPVSRWSAVAACHSGATDRARQVVEDARRSAVARGARMDEAWETWLLGLLAMADGRRADAAEHLVRCRRLSSSPRYPFILGRALLGLSRLEPDPERAWDLAHEGLDVLVAFGDRVGGCEALEAVAGLAVARERAALALRLLAAASGFREASGAGRLPLEDAGVAQATAGAWTELGDEDAEACWADGAGLSLEDAVAYARRGRGARDRPVTGWASLTPTERELVRLVADGHTNARIGERLFISPNTVKKHLSAVYAKMGVAGRAELAAEVARHEP